MEEVLHRLSCEKTYDSDSEVVNKPVDLHEISADEDDSEAGEVITPTSSVWSSFNTIIPETAGKYKSPMKYKIKHKDPNSSSKKYQRSKRMTSLIDDGAATDTDDNSEEIKVPKMQAFNTIIHTQDLDLTDDEVTFSPKVKENISKTEKIEI